MLLLIAVISFCFTDGSPETTCAHAIPVRSEVSTVTYAAQTAFTARYATESALQTAASVTDALARVSRVFTVRKSVKRPVDGHACQTTARNSNGVRLQWGKRSLIVTFQITDLIAGSLPLNRINEYSRHSSRMSILCPARIQEAAYRIESTTLRAKLTA